ncbi:12-oxophytodienoate reductase [Novosphingobium resinovorum]|uniref:oxidoreductase n=1 Tax=Novosphingobium TaxID=165696 RepID=UPI001B3C7435|nr:MULTISPECIES: 12-oxophytodienoate reductase [Novosphingobium]MBF7014723.1 12-oxophytodienoate reductase [Novosphingobium sp. HR1a]WJM24795.1 12-oxophytodienoate reductase [Novosphingobium resinovorum]
MSAVDVLFSPGRIGGLEIPNRIAMAPMTREFSHGGVPGPDVAAYYARRAAGGCGLIITEGMAVNAAGAHDGPIPLFYQPQTLAACRAIVDGVHRAGARIMPQLWHVGVQDSPTEVNPQTVKQRPPRVGPSGLLGTGEVGGEVLDERGIADTIADFARAAQAAREIGFDGIEIHGAHGYLPDQFLWSRTNRRRDGYGGDARERTRFVVELIRACKAAAGPDFPIVLRMSQWKSFDYAARLAETPLQLEAIFLPIAEAGVDAFHCSTRRFWEPAFAESDLTLAGWMRKITGSPTIAVGSVTLENDFKHDRSEATGGIAESAPRTRDVEAVASFIERGEFDMIAVGRAMIANPDWAALVRSRETHKLRSFRREQLAALD